MKKRFRNWLYTYRLFRELGIRKPFRASFDKEFCRMVMED